MRIKNTAIKSCVRSYLGGQDHFHSVKGNCQIVAIQEWISQCVGTTSSHVENHPRKKCQNITPIPLLLGDNNLQSVKFEHSPQESDLFM